MYSKTNKIAILITVWAALSPLTAAGKKEHGNEKAKVDSTENLRATLWRNPSDVPSRDLFYGPGGSEHQPRGPYTFVKEDMNGTNPKFVVEDADRVKWTVKLGEEARPETVATRLVWGAGYFADEDYFLPELHVAEMPSHLHRGQKLVAADGSVRNVRLKRSLKGEDKLGRWKWRDNPFTGTRELDGLRVLMALINNWDVKDDNNAIYKEGDERIYLVSDLGASFGTAGLTMPHSKAKGNLNSYSRSGFIRKSTAEYVDFREPGWPFFLYFFNPPEYWSRVELRWIGKRIPRADARWTGDLLARLTPKQIRDAFRAAGYTVEQVEDFADIVEHRIAELRAL